MLTQYEIERIILENDKRPAAAAIAKRLSEGMIFATVHAELQEEDGEFWVDLGPLDYFGPIAVPPDMKGGEQLNVIVRKVEGTKDGQDSESA